MWSTWRSRCCVPCKPPPRGHSGSLASSARSRGTVPSDRRSGPQPIDSEGPRWQSARGTLGGVALVFISDRNRKAVDAFPIMKRERLRNILRGIDRRGDRARSDDTDVRMMSYWRNQPPSMCKENGRFRKPSLAWRLDSRILLPYGATGFGNDRFQRVNARCLLEFLDMNPKIGPDWTLAGKQKYVRTPGCNEKRYLAGALRNQNWQAHLGRGRPQEQPRVSSLRRSLIAEERSLAEESRE